MAVRSPVDGIRVLQPRRKEIRCNNGGCYGRVLAQVENGRLALRCRDCKGVHYYTLGELAELGVR